MKSIVLILATLAVLPISVSAEASAEARIESLSHAARQGKREAIRALVKELPESDGALAEAIAINLGKSIRKQPRIFLEELQRANLASRVDDVVGTLGPAFVDQYAAQVKELQLRRKALVSVKDPALAPLLGTCLAALDRQISEVRQQVSPTGGRAGKGN